MIVGRPIDDIARVRSRIDEHVTAELTSDPATIMSTISAEPFFPVLVRDERGLAALTNTDAVTDFYAARVGVFEILDSTRVTEIRTDWYALHESAATVHHVGDHLGLPPSGAIHNVHSVVLFPTDHDGIVGELEWTRVDFSKILRQMPIGSPRGRDEGRVAPIAWLDAARLHDRIIEAWLDGETRSLADLMGDAPWAGHHVHRDGILPSLVARPSSADLSEVSAAFTAVGCSTALGGCNDTRRRGRLRRARDRPVRLTAHNAPSVWSRCSPSSTAVRPDISSTRSTSGADTSNHQHRRQHGNYRDRTPRGRGNRAPEPPTGQRREQADDARAD